MEIKKILPDIRENIILAKETTFNIGGPARYFFVAREKEDLIKAIKAAKQLKLPFFVLGGGSNVLFSDKGYKGLVINFQSPPAFLPLKAGRDSGIQKNKITAGAGTNLGELVMASFKKGLAGLEWAVGIPGTVGGAVCGNSGTFGFSIGNIIEEVEALDTGTLRIKRFSQKNCRFSYRNSIFRQKGGLIILSVCLKLKKGDKKKIQEKMTKFLNHRKTAHPYGCFSAGCVFKNYKGKISDKKILESFPELKRFNKKKLIPASYLIDKCGLKGRKRGEAEISERHANFIVNLGGAKAKDVVELMKIAKQEVKNKFGVILKEEVEIINI
jgi:UDP-N-acetylmuramate dehydrogenase